MRKKLRYILVPAFTLSFGASLMGLFFVLLEFGDALKTACWPARCARAPARVLVRMAGGPTGRMSAWAAALRIRSGGRAGWLGWVVGC